MSVVQNDGGGARAIATVADAEAAAVEGTLTPRSRVLSASVIEIGGYGFSQVIRLGSNLALTRLLFPEAFAVMAMLQVTVYSLFMLTDVGLAQAVVRSERGDDPVFINTAWSLQVSRGFGLWVAVSLLAYPLSLYYHQPMLTTIVPVGSSAVFIYALGSSRIYTNRRKLNVLPIGLVDLTAQIGSTATMIALAYSGLGVWALVVGNVASAAIHASGSYLLPGTHRQKLHVDPQSRTEILNFGRWIFGSSAMTVFATRGDQLLLGHLISATSFGLYNTALQLAEAPEAAAGRVITGVFYPVYARAWAEAPKRFAEEYYRTRLLFDVVVHSGLGALVALSGWIIDLLYDDRYAGAEAMLQILAIRTVVQLLTAPCETALIAQGLSQYLFRRNLVVAVATFAAMPIGNHFGGTAGVLWGATLARMAALVTLWPAARRQGFLRLERELLVLPILAAGYGIGRVILAILPDV